MFRHLENYRAIRKILAGFILSVLVATSFLVSAEPAISSTPVTFSVTVKDNTGNALDGQLVDFCDLGTGEWKCAHQTNSEAVTDVFGRAEIGVILPNGTGFVQLQAGGYNASGTSYSKNWQRVDFVNGIPDWQPEIILVPTTYKTVTVTVENNATPAVRIKNEFVELSSGGFGPDSNAMREWAVTGNEGANAGKAIFHLDEESWGDVGTITAAVGLDSWSRFDFTSATVDLTTGSARIVVASTIYNLRGNIERETQSPQGFEPFANQDFCLWYWNSSTEQGVSVDFSTDKDGDYLVENVLSRDSLQFQPHACNSYDEYSLFDYPSKYGSDITVVSGVADVDVQFTSKGLKVTASHIEGGQTKPAAFVQLRIDLQDAQPNQQDYRIATTNAYGVAYFTNLQEDTDYLLSYNAVDDPWSTPRFEDFENPEVITIGESLTTRTITLERRDTFPETPVKITGTVLNPGILGGQPLANGNLPGTPIANAIVNVHASFGSTGRVSFRARTDPITGYFEISGLPHGWIWVDVSAAGHRSVSRGFQTSVEEDPTYELGNLRLRSSLSGDLEYAGVLRDIYGEPVPGIKLVLSHPYDSGKQPESQTTDSQGRFSFKGLSTGHHWMYAQADWEIYDWNSWGFNLQASKLNGSHVILERGVANPNAQASISGRVYEYLDVEGPSSAMPLEGVCVQLYPTSGGTASVGTTDAFGNWSVTGLIDGDEYWIDTPKVCETNSELGFDFVNQYERPDYGNSIAVARVSGGTLHEWAFKQVSQSGSGSVSGRVRDGDSYRNLAGVEIYLERANGGRVTESVTTDSRGEYEFLNLPAGEYYISTNFTDPDLSIDGESYDQAWISVEVTTEANRANILLYKTLSDVWDGIFSGTILDEYLSPHGNARVIVTDPDEYFFQREAETDHEGKFEISDLPVNTNLLYRIIPWWQELAIVFGELFIGDSKVEQISETLELGSSISGQISNIPQGLEVRKIFAELLDLDGNFVQSAEVDLKTGQYSMKRVPAGQEYVLRFTQNVTVPDWWNWSEPAKQSVSLKPVYWNEGSAFGTTDLQQATEISVGAQPVLNKNITFSEGSSLQGSVSIATATNPIPLSGARYLYVDLFKLNSEGEWKYVTWSELSAKSDFKYQFVGLAEGEYKVQFIDTRQGNNSLISNFNGGAETLEDAPVINIGEAAKVVLNHTMSIAPPETSAEAFDLDSLSASELAELKDAISLESESSPGSEIEVFVGTEFAGNFVSAFANSTPVVLGTWQQVDSLGYIKVKIPTTLPGGSHRIGVLDSQAKVFGWAPITITATAAVAEQPAAQPAAAKAKPKSSKAVVEAEPELAEEKSVTTEEAVAAPAVTDSSGDWLLPLAGGFLLIAAVGSAWALRTRRVGIRRK